MRRRFAGVVAMGAVLVLVLGACASNARRAGVGASSSSPTAA